MSERLQERVELVVRAMAQTATSNEDYFSQLDAVVGDGDFGFSLARGFEVVLESWDDLDRSTPSAFLRRVAVTITSRTGGTSGPIWGTGFLRAAGAITDDTSADPLLAVTMLRSAIDGIKERGKAEVGDKTLLDALVPATDALEESLRAGSGAEAALAAAAKVAREAATATSSLQARRGRASYTGERSVGSPDPGAVAIAVMFEDIVSAGGAAWSEPTGGAK